MSEGIRKRGHLDVRAVGIAVMRAEATLNRSDKALQGSGHFIMDGFPIAVGIVLIDNPIIIMTRRFKFTTNTSRKTLVDDIAGIRRIVDMASSVLEPRGMQRDVAIADLNIVVSGAVGLQRTAVRQAGGAEKAGAIPDVAASGSDGLVHRHLIHRNDRLQHDIFPS